jgi:hypothetical protein
MKNNNRARISCAFFCLDRKSDLGNIAQLNKNHGVNEYPYIWTIERDMYHF